MTANSEVVTRDEQLPYEAQEHHSTALTPMDMIDRALSSGADPDTLGKLLALQERWQAAQDKAEFAAAKAAAMAEMPPIPRSGLNKHTGQKYSTIDDIRDTVRPVLARHGMTLTHRTKVQDGELLVTAVLAHANGQEDTNSLPLPFDNGQQRNAAQARGSSQTYGERYTAKGLLGLSTGDEDDDGRAAGGRATINADQWQTLRTLLDESGANEDVFLKFYGAPTLDEFPAAKFDHAKAKLEAKRKEAK